MGFLSSARAAGEWCLRLALGSAVSPGEPCAHMGSFENEHRAGLQTETKLGRKGGQGLL